MENGGSVKSKTFKGTLWSTLERFSAQGIAFVVMIVMARILTPADYGLVGMVAVFIGVAQSLVDSGFSQALIRKLDRSQIDNSTSFFFNIGVGTVLYALIWFLAPVLSDFYGQPKLLWITRVLCLSIIFNSLVVVQRALLTVEIDFKTQAKASIIASVLAGATGIVMAYRGFGVWSIVAFQLLISGLNCLLLWLYSSWRPEWLFSWASFRHLFSFGYKLALSGFIHTMYVNGFNMVIGKVYKAADLGFYTRGQQFVSFFSANISGVLQKVTYPVLCRYQEDDEKLGVMFLKMIRISSLVVFSCMMLLGGVAKPMIGLFLGERWMFAATIIQILCFGYMWFSVYSLNQNILLVKGRSDLFLKLEIVKKIFFVGVLCAFVPLGLIWVCWGVVVNSLIEVAVNSFYTGKIIGVSIWRQLKELFPALIYSLSLGLVSFLAATFIPGSYLVQFLAGGMIGAGYFLAVLILTRNRDFYFLLEMVRKKK